jgi:hypothetical protein
MARGTDFGGIHSHRDLNLIQQSVEVDPAEPKLNMVEIPGADGAVDMSEQPAGRVVFNTRKITWTYALYPGESWDAKHRQVSNVLNGRKCNITLDTDPEYYYVGRLSVTKHNIDNTLRQITIVAICQPYKLRQEQTVVFVPFSGKNLLDVSEANQLSQLYGSVEYIPDGVRKSGPYFVGFKAFVKPNTTYFLSVNTKTVVPSTPSGGGGRIAIFDPDIKNSIAQFRSTEGSAVSTFNSGNHTKVAVLLYSDSATADGIYEFTNLQLEPIQATGYEPFTEQPEKEVVLQNDRKPVVPTLVLAEETTLLLPGGSIKLSAGTHRLLALQLTEGETRFTMQGTGAVHITYQEGSL